MSNKVVAVGLRIDGDASGARKAAADTASDLTALAEDAAKVKILDTAVASVERFDAAVQSSQAKVRALRETLGEAYAAGADAPMIRKLEKDLAAVERQAQQAAGALQQAQTTVVDLNLRFADAGISTANLADKKAELIQRSQSVAQAAQEEAEWQRYLANETERAAKAAAQLAADTKFEAQRQAAIEYQKSAEYAGWWADSLDKVEQAQADLDAALDLDRQRQANIQTQKSAEYAEWWAQELAQVDRAAQVAGASTTRLNRAFNTLNIRSADQIDAEILEINQALLALAKRADLTGAEFDRAFGAAQQRLHALKQEAAGGGEALDDVGKRAGNASALLGKLGLAFGGLELARQFVTVNAELENIERSFRAVTGSVERSAAEMDYARGVAVRLGVEQLSTAKSYASLMAATKGTASEGEKTRQIFESVTRAMSLAGKSSADTEGALLALQQMANKGVVAMEELRGQLGERLPGALNATADGLGITTAQLIKLVETGQMTADELFPALAAGLNKLYKEASTETLSQEWQHFKAAVQDAYEQIGDAGVVDVLKTALEGMEAVVFGVSTGIVAMGKNIGVLTAALANGDIGVNGFSENAKKAFAEIEEEVRQRTVRIAQHNTLVAAGLDETGKKMLDSARQQSETTTTAASDWTRLNVAYNTVKDSGDAATKQAQKLVEATKASGEASTAAAAAMGGEADQRRAKAAAALADADALAALAERRREELAMADGHVAALQAEAAAAGGATEQQQKVIDGLIKTADARRVESQEATAQAERAQYAASAAKVEAAAYEALRGSLSQWSQARQAQMSLDQASIRLAIEQKRTTLEVAKAKGDELGAARALIEMKRLEIKLAELTAAAKRAEADATLAAVKAEREALAAKGQLSAAKEAELKASEAGARVKQVEAQIAGETAKRLRDLAQATSFSGGAAMQAAGQYDGLADSLRGVEQAARAASSAQGAMETRTPMIGVQADPRAELYKRGASVDEVAAAVKYYDEYYKRNELQYLSSGFQNYQDMAAQTSRAIGDAVEKALAAGREELRTGKSVDLGTSAADLVAQASATKRVTSWEDQQRLLRDAGAAANAQPMRRVQIDLLGSGGKKSTVFANDQAAADGMINLLEQASRRSIG